MDRREFLKTTGAISVIAMFPAKSFGMGEGLYWQDLPVYFRRSLFGSSNSESDYIEKAKLTLIPRFLAHLSIKNQMEIVQKPLSAQGLEILHYLARSSESLQELSSLLGTSHTIGYGLGYSAFKDSSGQTYDSFSPLIDGFLLDDIAKLEREIAPLIGVDLVLDNFGNRFVLIEH